MMVMLMMMIMKMVMMMVDELMQKLNFKLIVELSFKKINKKTLRYKYNNEVIFSKEVALLSSYLS